MRNSYFYLAGKILAAIISAILLFDTANTGILIIRMLVLCCLFALQLLLSMLKNGAYEKWSRLCQVGALVYIFFMGIEDFFPLIVVAGMELLDVCIKGNLFYEVGVVALLLIRALYTPSELLQLFTVVFVVFLLLLRFGEDRRRLLWEANLEQKERIEQLKKRLEDMQVYARTVQDVAVAEERNRFASRIHDQLGHNISGSIILLEATSMMLTPEAMGDTPDTEILCADVQKLDAARKNISIVTENLRNGVDDIRAALRQERPDRSRLGLSEIKMLLEEFQITYGRQTSLYTEGELEKISIPLWVCIRDNMKEALTNMLKHSEGTAFTLQIKVMNKAIRVEYTDNGRCSSDIKPGMGLTAIEERTAACGGTTLFTGGQSGFRIVTVFL